MEGGAGGGGGAAQDGGTEEAGRRREGEGRVPGHAGGRWSQAVSVAFILLFLDRLNWIGSERVVRVGFLFDLIG
jgi:hypothetical protein